MDSSTIVQIVTIITGGIVTLGTLYIRSRLLELERELRELKAVLAGTQAILLGRHDPIAALKGVIIQLEDRDKAAHSNIGAVG